MALSTSTTGTELARLATSTPAPGTSNAGTTTTINLTQRDVSTPSHHASSADPEDDPVLAASRLADSSVPDGGYGWVVVLGCAVITWWFVGTNYSWGVIQAALVEGGLSSPATLSFVGSLCMALISALAIVNGRLARWLGARRTGMLGVSLLGAAEVMSSFSVANVAGLFVTNGVVLGLGMR